MDDLPYKIKRLREFRNFTQEYMAECLGIRQRGYSKIESGHTALSVWRLKQIAIALECHPGDLMDKSVEDLLMAFLKG